MPVNLSEIPQKLSLGLEAVQLLHAERTLRQSDHDVARYRNKMFGGQDSAPAPEDDRSESMLIFGDVNMTDVTRSPTRRGVSPITKALVGGALLVGGGGLTLGALSLRALLDRPAPQPGETIEIEIDRDWRLGQPVVE